MTNGKWLDEEVPHDGWSCVGIEDLGEPSEVCEMCETQEIRYVHLMEHDDWPEILRCGCVCAGHMEGDVGAARDREKRLRNLEARRERFPEHPGWRTSRAGNAFIRTREGFVVTIFRQRDAWSGCVSDEAGERRVFARRAYASADDAKRAAFDAVAVMATRRSRGRQGATRARTLIHRETNP